MNLTDHCIVITYTTACCASSELRLCTKLTTEAGSYRLLAADSYMTHTCKQKKESEEDERIVYHFHFKAWPDHGVPDDPGEVLDFLVNINTRYVSVCACVRGVLCVNTLACKWCRL